MAKQQSARARKAEMERLIFDLETAWLEGSDADVSNLIDAGVRDPARFAWALVGRVADERARLLLSVQRALVGATSPSLLGVCADLRDETILLTFYVGSEATDEEVEDLGAVGAEVVADFTENYRLNENVRVVAEADQPLLTVGDWVHLQRGFRTFEG